MTSAALAQKARFSYPWMFGREFDLLFFFAPIFFGIALLCMNQLTAAGGTGIWMVILLNAFGAGPFHQGPTWFFYLDKKHRQYFASNKQKQIIFYAGPPLVMLASIALMVFIPGIGFALTMAWAVQHLIQQNIGILLLYHNPGKEAVVPRPLEARSLWASSLFFASLFVYRIFVLSILKPADPNFSTSQAISLTIVGFFGLYALGKIVQYLIELNKQVKAGYPLNVPATVFWAVSVLCFVPFGFFGKAFDEAFVIPVTIHWFQYIGLNYMLVKHKYSSSEAPDLQNLPKLPGLTPFTLFFSTCLLILAIDGCLIVTKTSGAVGHAGIGYGLVFGMLVGMANVHYFLDAFIWRFRESYQRAEVLPHLLRSKQQTS